MNSELIYKLLLLQLESNKKIEISVTGYSMNPTLYESDLITVEKSDNYKIGDMLIFIYKNNELLVHRLLDIKDGKYFCKGDNSFRLEDITGNKIIGKVVKINGINITSCPTRLTVLSYLVNRAFIKCRYNIDKTKETYIYKLYEKVILKKEAIDMYKKNENMDYIEVDDTSMAVFDPETSDTHFFDEIGIDILNILSEPCDIDGLLNKLCDIYEVTPVDIREDVKVFLDEAISKNVIEIL